MPVPTMRPLRLLLSLATSLITITLLLYLVFGSQHEELQSGAAPSQEKGLFKSLFSFTSPASLFPPSAIISLTDDNSTFFLARPAAFGPALPPNSLSAPLWIGSGFSDDAMSKGGELGCSDMPAWDEPDDPLSTLSDPGHASKKTSDHHKSPLKEQPHGAVDVAERSATDSDATDHHLRPTVSMPHPPTYRVGKSPQHADIESLQQTAEITGKIVLLKRGGCGFLEKVKWAQNRGAVALIVGDDQRGGALVRMYARGDTSNVTIPALFTSHTTAHLLSSLLPSEGSFHHVLPGGSTESTFPNSQQANPTLTRRAESTGWLASIFASHRVKNFDGAATKDATRRPPISGQVNRASAAEEDVGHVNPKSKPAAPGSTPTPVDYVIGEQHWRDTAFITSSASSRAASRQSALPNTNGRGSDAKPDSSENLGNSSKKIKGWFNQFLEGEKEPSVQNDEKKDHYLTSPVDQLNRGQLNNFHEGLWVTLTPTNMSTSPFFDTLLVLVVSPLVTLTIVYALLLLRSRIRRRRWRAPKSLVERLPVRTYQTISDSSPSATPVASSPTTPLLQHEPPRPSSSLPRPRSRADSEVPATSSSVQQTHRTPEEEKRESGLAAWRRKYGGRQKECVVCLEEYVDGISRVMSLPCGHEFHADCM